jgi:hypothetical protein
MSELDDFTAQLNAADEDDKAHAGHNHPPG